MPTRIIATSFALVAFAASVLGGLAVDNPAVTILWRALMSMVICYTLGVVIGTAAQRAVDEHIENYKKQHPLVPADVLAAQMAQTGGADESAGPRG
jgi:putative Mn2+ efflux pump MntP